MNFKNKDKFYIILSAVVIAILAWAFISAAVITHDFKRKAAKNKLDNKKVYVEDLLLTETKEGKKYWEIYADKGQYEDIDKIAYVTDAIGNFYDKNEKVVASFKSPRATVNSETGSVVMYDRSILMYKDFTSIIADEFTYNGKDKPIYAKGNVVIENKGQFIVKGSDAVLTEEMTKITVYGKVESRVFERGK